MALVAALLAVVVLAVPAGASAAVVTGAGDDPAGDQSGGGPAADILSFRAAYDDAGTISGQVRLAAPLPASSATFAFVFFGVAQPDGSCATVVGVGDSLGATGSSPTWGTPADPDGGGPATRAVPDATTLALSATSAALAGRPLDCAFAATSAGGGTGDRTAPVGLRAEPGAPPPQPPPSQPPTTQPPVQQLPIAPPPEPRAAKLQLTVSPPAPLAPGRSATVRVVVRNAGGATARGVRLRVGGRGVVAAPAARTLGTLRAGARRTVPVRITRRAGGGGPVAVRFRATAGRRLSAARTLHIPRPAPRRPTPPKPVASSGDLAGRAYMRLVSGSPGVSQDTRTGYVFTGPRFVYRGMPEGGVPACSRRTAAADGDGCLPYTYDARTGRLRIDGRPAALDRARTTLTVGEERFVLKQSLAPGQRLSVSLKNIEIYGLWPNQTVFTAWLTLTAGGEFAFSGSALGSLGNGSPSVISTTIAPDKRGTYAIVKGSAIELRYADGRVDRRTILIDGTPTGSVRLDPQREGLLLDGTAWWS